MEEVIFYDKLWQEKYPRRYELFRNLYQHPLISIEMSYLKSIRRHGVFPHNGLLPVFDLATGKPLMGFLFTKKKKSKKVKVVKFTSEMSSVLGTFDIEGAWNIYYKEIEVTITGD